MNNTKLMNVDISSIDIDSISVDDVVITKDDFLTRKQHEEIIERIKESLRELNNPDRWVTWEEFISSEKENGFY